MRVRGQSFHSILDAAGTLYYADFSHTLSPADRFAVDTYTGKLKWSVVTGEKAAAESTPLIGPDGTFYYVNTTDHDLRALGP